MIGWTMPDRNCAPKEASKRSWFLSSNVCSASARRPNTFTSSWPVNTSSTWALRSPVLSHWAMKWSFERRVMNEMKNNDTGIVTIATSASSTSIDSIMMMTPTIVNSDTSIWLSVCWRLCARLSMSFVTRLRRSPRGIRSTLRSGRRLSFSSTSVRRRNIVRCTMPARTYACIQPSAADTT